MPLPPPPLSAPSHRLLLAAATLTAGALLYLGVTSLTDAYATVSKASVQASEALADAAAERHQALEALGAKVAHELKNPLTALSGLLELMREDQPTHRIEVMLGEVRRMEGLIRDYLSFNRPWDELNRAPTNLRALADQVTTLFEARAIQAGIRLRCEGPALEARIDAARIKEALINLVLNALEASPSGGQVRVTEFENRSALVVEDQGAGMSSETVARSTDAFFTTRAQRLEDLPLLVECFRARHAERFGIDSVCFEPQLLDALASRPWPGNVRELENVVQRLLALSDEGRVGPEALEQSAAPAPHSLRERLESLSAKYWRRRWTKPATTTHRAPGGWASPEPRSWTN